MKIGGVAVDFRESLELDRYLLSGDFSVDREGPARDIWRTRTIAERSHQRLQFRTLVNRQRPLPEMTGGAPAYDCQHFGNDGHSDLRRALGTNIEPDGAIHA